MADAFGVATVYVVADDGGAVDSRSTQSFVLTVNSVNDAPNFALSAAAVVLDEDFATTQAISVVSSDDGDDDGVSQPLTYSLSTSHVGFATLSVDDSGTVSISSVADAFGVATVYVVVDDGGSTDSRSTQSFTLTVNNVNDAPNFALSTAALSLEEDFGSTQVTVASSDDGDGTSQSLAYSISTTAVGFATLSIDGSGTVSISSVADGFGVATVEVTLTDDGLVDNLSTQSFVLTVNNINDAPNFALSTTALVVDEDFGSTQVTVASSDDGDGTSQSLSYSLSTSHVGFATLSVDGSGTVSISSVADGFGVATVYVVADDSSAANNLSTQSFVLTVNNINDAPIFTLSTTALVVDEDFGSTQVTVASSDDGDGTSQSLSYSISTTAVGFATLSIDGSGTVSISSVADAFGTATIYVVADDGGAVDSRSTQSFVLTVNAVNDAPQVLVSSTTLHVAEAQQVAATVLSTVVSLFSDIDSTLSYTISSGNAAALFAIDANSGAITLAAMPTDAQSGLHTLQIEASDGLAAATATLHITLAAINHPPTFSLSATELVLDEDFIPQIVEVTASDDGDADSSQALSYAASLSGDVVATLAIDAQSGTVTITSIADAFGTATIVVTADDGSTHNRSSTRVITLRVNSVAGDAPVFNRIVQTTVSTYATGLFDPIDVALSTDGRLFVSDGQRIVVVSSDGAIANYAGSTFTTGYTDGAALNARFAQPTGLALLPDGRLLVADRLNHRIRAISADGATVSTYAGNGFFTNQLGYVNQAPLLRTLGSLNSVAAAPDGRVFAADETNGLIIEIDASGTNSVAYAGVSGATGFRDGVNTQALFNRPRGMVVHPDGRLFVADISSNRRIRVISAEGTTVSTYAGSGDSGYLDGSSAIARFDFSSVSVGSESINDMVVHPDGRLFIADFANHVIRVVSADGSTVSTHAGIGRTSGSVNGPALSARFNRPGGLALSADGSRLFVADRANGRIRVIDESVLHTIPVVLADVEQVVGAPLYSAEQLQAMLVDPDGDATYSIIGGNEAGLFSIDPASGALSLAAVPTDAQAGDHQVLVQADDGANAATVTLTVTLEVINDPPTFSLSESALTLTEDFGSAQVTVVSSDDGDSTVEQPLSYAISTTSIGFANLVIDADSGTLTLSSVADGFGVVTVTVTVDDGSAVDSRSTQSFVLTVNAINDAPSFALSAAAVVLDEDFATTQAISVVSSDDGDIDGVTQTLSYSLSTSHVGFATLSVDGSGTVSISSVADGFGVATVYVVADDGGAVDSRSTQSFTLTVNNINDAPNFALSTTALVVDEDFGIVRVTIASSDSGDDGIAQTLTYSISTTAVGFATLSIDGSGTVSISSVADAFGVATVYVVADDGGAVDSRSTQSFVLTVNAVNDAPNFALSAAAVVLDEDFATTQAISVVSSDDGDIDGVTQTLSYSLSTSHVGFATLSVDGSGTVSISSVADGFGVATVYVVADDGGAVDSRSTQSFTLTVNNINDAPNFALSTTALVVDEDFGIVRVTIASSDSGDDGIAPNPDL